MRLFKLIAGVIATSAVLSNAVSAKDIVLDPQSEWALDSDDESCALVRAFDDGDDVVQLELRQFKPGGAMQVQVISNGRLVSNRDHMSYRFEPGTEWQERNWGSFMYIGVRGKFQGAVFDASLIPSRKDQPNPGPVPPSDPKVLEQLGAALGAIDGLSVTDVFGDKMTLHTGSLAAPFAALRQCLGKVVTKWGLDPFVQSTLTKVPVPVNTDEIGASVQKAFPQFRLLGANPAIIQIRLMIDSSGKATACSIYGPLSGESRPKAACEALSSQRFEPALDGKGKPVASFWLGRVYYDTKTIGYIGGG